MAVPQSPASPARAGLIAQHFVGDEDCKRVNFTLASNAAATPGGSILRTTARRVHQSAIKEIAGNGLSFAGALTHFSLFDRVSSLEKENGQLKDEVEELRQALILAQERAAAAEETVAALKPAETEQTDTAEQNTNDPENMSKPQLVELVKTLEQELAGAQADRRKVHNQLVEMRGAIRVYCRVRPLPAGAAGALTVRVMPDGSSLLVHHSGQDTGFNFCRVFAPSTTQQEVFGEVSELVQSALDGFHVCIVSYGQTGSGKTHNMQGNMSSPDGQGLIPRAVNKILSTVQRLGLQGWTYTLEASCIELYNNSLRDLLDPGGRDITDMGAIKHDQNGGSHTVVTGVSQHPLTSATQALALLQRAANARASNSTAMNAVSSRSHQVFTLNITGTHGPSGTRLTGALCLVDLAGSERLDRSRAEGVRKTEACAINSTLSSLGDVFEALNFKAKHIPYRNSKLTWLLKPCLSPGGKTLFMVHVNPEEASAYETLTSLRFATKVAGTELGAPARKAVLANGETMAAAPTPAPVPSAAHISTGLASAGPASAAKRPATGPPAGRQPAPKRQAITPGPNPPSSTTPAVNPWPPSTAQFGMGPAAQEGRATPHPIRSLAPASADVCPSRFPDLDDLQPITEGKPLLNEEVDLRGAMRRKRGLNTANENMAGDKKPATKKGAWH